MSLDGQHSDPAATMQRLQSASDSQGEDYEYKMAALLALRLCRQGARFEMFSNVKAALPLDDIVVRLVYPKKALLLVQLKHKSSPITEQFFIGGTQQTSINNQTRKQSNKAENTKEEKQVGCTQQTSSHNLTMEQANQTENGKEEKEVNCNQQTSSSKQTSDQTTQTENRKEKDVTLRRYFNFFLQLHEWGNREDKSELSADERILCETPLKDVWFVLYTPADWRGNKETSAEAEVASREMPFEEDLYTHEAFRCFSFVEDDQKIWDFFNDDQIISPRISEFRTDFLPNFKIFCEQSVVGDLDELIRQEIDRKLNKPAPSILEPLLQRFKNWAQDKSTIRCVTERMLELWEAVAEDLRKTVRTAAGEDILTFKDECCYDLRDILNKEDAIHVIVPRVPQGIRAAKIVQVLDEQFDKRWTYVSDRELYEFPRAVLKAACYASKVVVVDVDTKLKKAKNLIKAIQVTSKVVLVSSGEDLGPVQSISQCWKKLEEDWRMHQLTEEAEDVLINYTVSFQGRSVALKHLKGTWPSLRKDVDGEFLSALVRGGAVIGDALPAPGDEDTYISRTLEHPSTLRADVLRELDPQKDHIVLSVFPPELLTSLQSELASPIKKRKKNECRRKDTHRKHVIEKKRHRSVPPKDITSNTFRWEIYSSPEQAKIAFENEKEDRNVHWLHCYEKGELIWMKTRGKSDNIEEFVFPASDRCSRKPTCVYTEEAARKRRVGLLVGEPGVGKSYFLQRMAAEANNAECNPKGNQESKRWTVMVQTLDHCNLLQKFPEVPTKDHLIELLAAAAGVAAQATSGMEAPRRFLQSALDHSGAITVFIDGFDGICPHHKDKLIQLVKLLLETKVKRLWISARPEVEVALSEALRCPSTTLCPLPKSEQKSFLCHHWSTALNCRSHKLEPLAEKVVAMCSAAQPSHLEIPLHLQIAAEKVAELEKKSNESQPENKITLHKLYRAFVEEKRTLYKKRFGLTDAKFKNIPYMNDMDNFDDYEHCAMLKLVPVDEHESFSRLQMSTSNGNIFKRYLEKNKENLTKEKCGILRLTCDKMPQFVHDSFVDYFAAKWIISDSNLDNTRNAWINLMEKPAGAGVRQMLKQMLAEDDSLHQGAGGQ